jgi:hypothetical protein
MYYGYDVNRHLQQYFSYIVEVSFIGGGNRRTRRKPPICHESDKLYYIMLYLMKVAINTMTLTLRSG